MMWYGSVFFFCWDGSSTLPNLMNTTAFSLKKKKENKKNYSSISLCTKKSKKSVCLIQVLHPRHANCYDNMTKWKLSEDLVFQQTWCLTCLISCEQQILSAERLSSNVTSFHLPFYSSGKWKMDSNCHWGVRLPTRHFYSLLDRSECFYTASQIQSLTHTFIQCSFSVQHTLMNAFYQRRNVSGVFPKDAWGQWRQEFEPLTAWLVNDSCTSWLTADSWGVEKWPMPQGLTDISLTELWSH